MRKVIHLSDENVVRRSSALRSDLLMYSPRLRKGVRAVETSFFLTEFWFWCGGLYRGRGCAAGVRPDESRAHCALLG